MSLRLDIDDATLDALAERITQKLDNGEQNNSAPGYMNVKSAAAYLDCKPQRIYDLVTLEDLTPHRDGSRLLFKTADLDDYVRNGDRDESY